MREIRYTKQYKRDYKRVLSRGKDMNALSFVMDILRRDAPLDPAYKDHMLRHNWNGYRELHIEPDWLLIYQYGEGYVLFARTGSHSDLFS